ncbi:MAG: hypothetical protein ACSW75_01850, partial [Lachnospiraceae bacterium]
MNDAVYGKTVLREDTMAKTLVLYDGRSSSAERVAVTLGCIIGKVRIRELSEAPASPEGFRNVLFVCNFYGALTASRTRDYISAHKEALSGSRIALVGVGFSDMGFVKYVSSLEAMLQLSEPLTTVFLRNEKMTVGVGAHLSRIFGRAARPLPAKALLESIEAFACAHSVLALATANEEYIRCTPVDYSYVDGKFYIVTEGGMKFRSILRNNHVSMAIFDNERHPDGFLDMLQVEGSVEVLPGDSPIAHREAAARLQRGGMDSSEIFVLCVTPQHYRICSAAFAAVGYDADQSLDAEQLNALRKEEKALSLANAASEESSAAYEDQEPSSSGTQANADSGDVAAFVGAPGGSGVEESAAVLTDDEASAEARTAEDKEASRTEADEAKEEGGAPDLLLAEGVDWVNFSVGDFGEAKEEKASEDGGAAAFDEMPEEAATDTEEAYGQEETGNFDESIVPSGQSESFYDEPMSPAAAPESFYEGLDPSAAPQTGTGIVGREMEAAFAEEDDEERLIKGKEPF